MDFVKKAAEIANDPIFGKEAMRNDNAKPDHVKFQNRKYPAVRQKSFVTNASVNGGSSQEDSVCVCCKESHKLTRCRVFTSYTLDERRAFVKRHALCFACLCKNHTSRYCPKKETCAKCNKSHPTAMHDDNYSLKQTFNRNTSITPASSDAGSGTTPAATAPIRLQSSATCVPGGTTSTVLHAILPVYILHNTDRRVLTYCFFDSGSDACFMTDELAELLGANGVATTLQLRTLHGATLSPSMIIHGLSVTDMSGKNPIMLPRVFTREEIPVDDV